MASRKYLHIFLSNPPSVSKFTTPQSGGFGAAVFPPRIRGDHSEMLRRRFNEAWEQAQSGDRAVSHSDARHGTYIEFISDPGFELTIKSLEDFKSKKIRLMNVRTEIIDDKPVTYATVYVANEKKPFFLKKFEEYANEQTEKGNFRHAALVESITDIRKAILESFWQDGPELIPDASGAWCEVWLSSDKPEITQKFEALLEAERIRSADGLILFPERAVKLIFANKQQLGRLIHLSDDIAEYRKAIETSDFWIEMENAEQAQWARNLLARLNVDPRSKVSVCLLDTGVNNGHPLLTQVLHNDDLHAVKPVWGTDDHSDNGHGTGMAGVACYGDLRQVLQSSRPLSILHVLESVKILPPSEENNTELWGYITKQAIYRVEIQAPDRKRILCMAIAAERTRDRGRPSSWSAAVDQITAGADAPDSQKKLFFICAGNIHDVAVASRYPESQATNEIHDPAQSWNAISVGAFTELNEIQNPSLSGYQPIADVGNLSPFTTTSICWEDMWPNKPEVVMEGGNLAKNEAGVVTNCEDLSLLTTHSKHTERLFTSFNATSAATAQASWFAAQIQHKYQDFWPETIRGLMIHSARWTDSLKRRFLGASPNKTAFNRMLRACGYGVPKLERAIYSANNALTLIAQGELQPFDKRINDEGDAAGYRTNEMHLYDLPWPKDVLLQNPNMEISMRVTLSYFIEPSPGKIGWKDRYRYASHGLRFDVKAPTEGSNEIFLKRINKAVRAEDEGRPEEASSGDGYWSIGKNGRQKGSIHSDIWSGTAAELAACGVIAVYPVTGWWKERPHLGRWNSKCRYSLIVSIDTPNETVDIYTPVAVQVGISTPTVIEIA